MNHKKVGFVVKWEVLPRTDTVVLSDCAILVASVQDNLAVANPLAETSAQCLAARDPCDSAAQTLHKFINTCAGR
jgi:hypothetical protein